MAESNGIGVAMARGRKICVTIIGLPQGYTICSINFYVFDIANSGETLEAVCVQYL
jgi:hypothetical protein